MHQELVALFDAVSWSNLFSITPNKRKMYEKTYENPTHQAPFQAIA
jgi:hypothetical protein